ncbi:Lrp/AsnC family transcriptional regulator [Kytococcus sedentarius]|uniref:Lrp/AsnC family transcriptional regulator n=1 Tax=Kytococcus sedentarius TaxID=1276 RepID=UPI0019521BB0|nr:Lrp/AsnC family transcriptional regulator [Kytococcus sedentarius]QRO86793.1 Lrp/AsnC family transcriptional regulator [Kytococcus sedentarius]
MRPLGAPDPSGGAPRAAGIPSGLDAVDLALVRALVAEPLAPTTRLAERAGTSASTATRRLARLRRRGVVRVVGRTLPGFAGATPWLVRAAGPPSVVGSHAERVARVAASRWVRVSRDGAELVAGVVTEGDGPVLPDLAEDQRLRAVRAHELLVVHGTSPGARTRPDRVLDATDHDLLRRLAVDGRLTSAELAAGLGVDPSTVARRRRHLEASGVLYYEADVDPAALGGAGEAMLWLTVAPGRLHALGEELADRPECLFVASTSGPTQLVVHLLADRAGEVLTFLDEALAGRGVAGVDVVRTGRILKRGATRP